MLAAQYLAITKYGCVVNPLEINAVRAEVGQALLQHVGHGIMAGSATNLATTFICSMDELDS